MNRDLPLLSIVIPTRNRMNYVPFAIESALRIACDGLEIVIEDNSDDDRLSSWIAENCPDPRISYAYSNIPTSQSGNYDRAMRRVTGEYVALIGDDDGVNPEIIDATLWAKSEGLDALTPSSLINYSWPDLHMKNPAAVQAGELVIRSYSGAVTYPDAKAEMMKCVGDAGQSFHNLPKAYFGIVRKECMDRVKEKTGTYFPGVSPDMAAALSIAIYVKRMCQIDYPLFIPGSSAKSNAGLSGMGRHIGRLSDQPHLDASCEENWSKIVPAFYSVQTIWAEAAVGALRANEQFDILRAFDVPRLYSDCIVAHPTYFRTIMGPFGKALQETQMGRLTGTARLACRVARGTVLRMAANTARRMGIRRGISSRTLTGLHNIDEAVQAFSADRKNEGRKFKQCIP